MDGDWSTSLRIPAGLMCCQVQSQLSQAQSQLAQNQNQASQSQKDLHQAKTHSQQVLMVHESNRDPAGTHGA